MDQPQQLISGEQWDSLKKVVSMLNASEAQTDAPLPPEWRDLTDHWQRLIVASTGDVQPFPVTEHFLSLLKMFIDGAEEQDDVAGGSRLVLEWAQGCVDAAAEFGLSPVRDSDKKVWIVIDMNWQTPD